MLNYHYVMFAWRTVGNYSTVACHHDLSKRLELILKHEEAEQGGQITWRWPGAPHQTGNRGKPP